MATNPLTTLKVTTTMPRSNRPTPPWTVRAPGDKRTERLLRAVGHEIKKRKSSIDDDDDISSVTIVVRFKPNTITPRRVSVQFGAEIEAP